jgi:hypothetical protein
MQRTPKQPDPYTGPAADVGETSVVLLKIVGGTLSPEQTRFNKLVVRVETLTHDIEATRALGDAHRPAFMQTIPPLESRCSELLRGMIVFLDRRLQQKTQKGFTEKDRQLARQLVCSLAIGLAQSGDAQMQAIFDAHSDHTLDDIDRENAAEAQAMLDYVLKGDAPKLDPSATAEEIMRAGAERLRERQEAKSETRDARKAKRDQATRSLKGAQPQEDPETVLRTLYRQLASKLHPDRERDPLARDRKNALMSQANAAYEKRDLMTLLKLQLTVERLDSEAIAGMAKQKMAALVHLLKEQVQTLEYELELAHGRLAQEFGVSPFDPVDGPSLARSLKDQRADLQAEVSQMEYDINRVSNNDSELKRWLKEQRKLMKQARGMSGMFGML